MNLLSRFGHWRGRSVTKFALAAVGLGLVVFSIGITVRDFASGSGSVPQSPYSVTAEARLDSLGEARELVSDHAGVIEKLLVRAGEVVKKDAPLAQIACDDVREQRRAAEAASVASKAQASLVHEGARAEEVASGIAAAKAAAATAKDAADDYERKRKLYQRGAGTKRAMIAAKNAADEARALSEAANQQASALRGGSRKGEIKTANANVEQQAAYASAIGAALKKCELRAPVDGTILRVFRLEGEYSGNGEGAPILSIGNLDKMIVRVEIDQRDVLRVKPGMPVEVWSPEDQVRYPGKLVELASQMGRKTTRSLDPADRFDRDILEGIVELDASADLPRIVGLRMHVGFLR